MEAARRDEALAERQAALVARGRDLWTLNCATCHGPGGEGVDAPALNAKEFLEIATDEQIHHVISSGVPGTAMAAWWDEFGGPLTDEQIRALVAYIRSWEEIAPSRPDYRSPSPRAAPSPEAAPSPTGSPSPRGAPEEPREVRVTITVTDRGCEPLEAEVEAGRPFVLRFRNASGAGTSLDAESLGQHVHAAPGETVALQLTALQEGDYRFECLGETHGDLLGTGVIRAV